MTVLLAFIHGDTDGFKNNEIGGHGLVQLAQDRDNWQAVVNTLMNLQVVHSVGNFLTNQGTVSFSKRTQL